MKVGVVSDVHGNLVALAAVLADMPDVDAVVNAGDVVGYNPWPAECVEAMMAPGESPAVPDRLADPAGAAGDGTGVPTVMGNHDRAVSRDTGFRFNAMAKAGVEYAREHLDEPHLDWLGGLADRRTLFDGRVRVVHGHPDDPDHYTMPSEFAPSLLTDEDVLVMGHTHVQHHATYEEGIVMNPGSVGQPRDGDPRAAYAVLDLDDLSVEHRRVEYDVDRVEEHVEAAGLPRKIGSRLHEGR